MSGHDPSALDELLHGVEGIGEVLGVLHRGHVVAHIAQALCEGRAAEPLLVEAEVNMVERRALVVDDDGRHHLLHVAHLSTGADDDRSRRYDLLAVGVLLCQRERVLARGHVDVQVAAEVAQGLHGGVEPCVLALLRAAGPHPVG